jgi:hypothetical protein
VNHRSPVADDARGQATVLIALAALLLFALAGLVLDGGFEAAQYRQAQNAADAGVLSAARSLLAGAAINSIPSNAQLATIAQKAIANNRAVGTFASLPTASVNLGPFPNYSTAQTADASHLTLQGGGSPCATVGDFDISGGNAIGSTQSLALPGASTASDKVSTLSGHFYDLVNGCASAEAGCTLYTATFQPGQQSNGTAQACSGVGLPANISTPVGTVLAQQVSPVVYGPPGAAGIPRSSADNVLTNVQFGSPGVATVTASTVTTSVRGGMDPNHPDRAASDAAAGVGNLGTSIGMAVEPQLSIGLSVSGGTAKSHVVATATSLWASSSCSIGAGGGTMTIADPLRFATVTLTFNADCTLPSLPGAVTSALSSLGITLTVQGGYANQSSGCASAPLPLAAGQRCQVTQCLARIGLAVGDDASHSACLAEAIASVTNDGGTGVTPSTTYALGDTASTTSPNFFFGVFGWQSTKPGARAAVGLYRINDLSTTAFNSAPLAVASTQVEVVSGQYKPLVTGGVYYLYGSNINNFAHVSAPAGWLGRVTSSGAHAVGGTLTLDTSGGAPNTFLSGGGFYVLPVVNPVSKQVLYYAVFDTVASPPAGCDAGAVCGLLDISIPVPTPNTTVDTPVAGAWTAYTEPAATTLQLTQLP